MTNESVKYIVFEQNRQKKESRGIALKQGQKLFLCWKVPLSCRFIFQVPRVIKVSSPLTI